MDEKETWTDDGMMDELLLLAISTYHDSLPWEISMNLVALPYGFISATPIDSKHHTLYSNFFVLANLVTARGDRDRRMAN